MSSATYGDAFLRKVFKERTRVLIQCFNDEDKDGFKTAPLSLPTADEAWYITPDPDEGMPALKLQSLNDTATFETTIRTYVRRAMKLTPAKGYVGHKSLEFIHITVQGWPGRSGVTTLPPQHPAQPEDPAQPVDPTHPVNPPDPKVILDWTVDAIADRIKELAEGYFKQSTWHAKEMVVMGQFPHMVELAKALGCRYAYPDIDDWGLQGDMDV